MGWLHRLSIASTLLLTVSASSSAAEIPAPLSDLPDGWVFKDIGHIHYWSGTYTDTVTGAVVEFSISGPEYFDSLCQAYPGEDTVVARRFGLRVCEQEFLDAREWQIAQLVHFYPDFFVGNPKYREMTEGLAPVDAGMLWITFMFEHSVWQFTATFCEPAERSRVLDLLLGKFRLNLPPSLELERRSAGGSPNTGVQRMSLRSTADAESLAHR